MAYQISPSMVSKSCSILSNYDTCELVENRVAGSGFTECAPHLYNTLSKTFCHLDKIEIFKKQLKTYIFSGTFDFETKTIRDCFAT